MINCKPVLVVEDATPQHPAAAAGGATSDINRYRSPGRTRQLICHRTLAARENNLAELWNWLSSSSSGKKMTHLAINEVLARETRRAVLFFF